MGLRDRIGRDAGPAMQRFQMREKLMSIGDDYWIEDDAGNKAYRVNGKAVRFRDTWILEDAHGNDVAMIREKKLRVIFPHDMYHTIASPADVPVT